MRRLVGFELLGIEAGEVRQDARRLLGLRRDDERLRRRAQGVTDADDAAVLGGRETVVRAAGRGRRDARDRAVALHEEDRHRALVVGRDDETVLERGLRNGPAIPIFAEHGRGARRDVGHAELDFSVALAASALSVEVNLGPFAREERVSVLDVEAVRDAARRAVLRVEETNRRIDEAVVARDALHDRDPRALLREGELEIAAVLAVGVGRGIAPISAAIVVRDDVRARATEPVVPVADRAGAVAVVEIARPVLLVVLRARALVGGRDAGQHGRDDDEQVAARREAKRAHAERLVGERPRLAARVAPGENPDLVALFVVGGLRAGLLEALVFHRTVGEERERAVAAEARRPIVVLSTRQSRRRRVVERHQPKVRDVLRARFVEPRDRARGELAVRRDDDRRNATERGEASSVEGHGGRV